MRTFPTLLAAALCSASFGIAYGQTAVPAATSNKLLNSMNFNYDAKHDQISAGNLQIKPSIANSSTTATTGTIVVAININAVSHFSANTAYHCSLMAIGGIIDTSNGAVAGGLESANRIAGSGTPSCTLTIPYSWTLPTDANAQSGLILVFGVAAVSGGGESATVPRSTLQLDGIENLPANGATSTFTFSVTL